MILLHSVDLALVVTGSVDSCEFMLVFQPTIQVAHRCSCVDDHHYQHFFIAF